MSDGLTDNKHQKLYTLRPVTTPLPSQIADTSTSPSLQKCDSLKHSSSSDSPVRDINEDDDGYDPYSDYHEPDQLFEKDPWR